MIVANKLKEEKLYTTTFTLVKVVVYSCICIYFVKLLDFIQIFFSHRSPFQHQECFWCDKHAPFIWKLHYLVLRLFEF